MSTRSRIGIQYEDGRILSIYCHWDGYLEHNGYILQNYYNTQQKVEALMSLGGLSCLGTETEEKVNGPMFFTQRTEKLREPWPATECRGLEEFRGEEYNYIYSVQNQRWESDAGEGKFRSLGVLLAEPRSGEDD